jgi:DNA invertase Pin-like site-specific DNA recombinase
MLEEARAGRVDLVAVWKLDRLGRSLAHLLRLTSDLAAWHVDLVSIRDAAIDTTTANGKLLLVVLGAFSQFEAGPHQGTGPRRRPPCPGRREALRPAPS